MRSATIEARRPTTQTLGSDQQPHFLSMSAGLAE